MEQGVSQGGGGGGLSSVSLGLFDKLYDGVLERCMEGGSRRRLIATLAWDLGNCECLPESRRRDEWVDGFKEAIVEVDTLSDAACDVLFSVAYLAQLDITSKENPAAMKVKWFAVLREQDVSTYRALILYVSQAGTC